MLTPVQRVGDIWLKRDDLWRGNAPAQGAKARTASVICTIAEMQGITELCSANDRNSSVPGMLARVCNYYGIGLRIYYPASKDPLSPQFKEAQNNGATLVPVRPGYMSVRRKRMEEYAHSTSNATVIGVGLVWNGNAVGEPDYICGQAETADQAANVLHFMKSGDVNRVVVPVGSGNMLAGIVQGLPNAPILGVCCGNLPTAQFPPDVRLIRARYGFHDEVKARIGDVDLDPTYEAKCAEFLQKGDLLWIVGHRDTQ